MADYAIVNSLTDYATELIQTDPSFTNNLSSQVNSDVKTATDNNYGVSYVTVDLVGKNVWYDLEPLTASAKAEMQMASLGTPSLDWWDTVKKIISVILAVAAFIIGALVGGWGLLAGAIIAGAVLLWSYLTSEIEYKQEMADINDEYTRQYSAGEITWAEYQEFASRKEKVMETEGIPWNTIIIVGGIGIFDLLALMLLKK